jgi:hypothetical protein
MPSTSRTSQQWRVSWRAHCWRVRRLDCRGALCCDNVVVTAHFPWCDARGMTKFLRADCVRIFGCSRFAVPPGDPVPKASSLAGDASIPDWYVSSRPRRRARSTNHGMTSRRIRCLTRRNAARGVEYILIAVVDGLKGFPEAIEAVFPQTMTQTCIVHLIRHALETVS